MRVSKMGRGAYVRPRALARAERAHLRAAGPLCPDAKRNTGWGRGGTVAARTVMNERDRDTRPTRDGVQQRITRRVALEMTTI